MFRYSWVDADSGWSSRALARRVAVRVRRAGRGPRQPRAGAGTSRVACAPAGGAASATSDLSGRQWANAAAIVAAGVRLGVPVRGQVIAVAAALQESSLWRYANATVPASFTQPHDRVGHDHDSVGLFQQRGGWGPVAARMNPAASATLFYTALLAVPHWQDLPLTVAADLVQHSALPDAYAKWETPADQIVGAVTGVRLPGSRRRGCPAGRPARPGGDHPGAAAGRGSLRVGWRRPAGTHPRRFRLLGPDGVRLRRDRRDRPPPDPADLAGVPAGDPPAGGAAAGDMLLFGAGGQPANIEHVGLYLGEGRMVHAPQTGQTVTITANLWQPGGYWASRFVGGVRGLPADAPTPSPA